MGKRQDYKNGFSVSREKILPGGLYLVELRDDRGDLLDKIRCDDYRESLAYYHSFKAIARNGRKGA